MFLRVSEGVDADLFEGWEPNVCHRGVLRTSQVLSETRKCGHAGVERLKLWELREGRVILTLRDLIDEVDLLEKDEVGKGDIRTRHELSVIGEQFSTSFFESGKSLLAELLSCRFRIKDHHDEGNNLVVKDIPQLRDPCLLLGSGAKQFWLEAVADVPVDGDRLSDCEIAMLDIGQVGELDGSTGLERGPFVATNLDDLVLPLSSAVGKQVASTVSSVSTAQSPVTKRDFISCSLCHSILFVFK